ncbi:LCP family protein [Caldicellulosiruptor naganoensis]|uniref:LCP family protein n=1 Tax=Caldicellulosiruptor naganoensis TaxID=29324 RepID=A0ABY7BDN8_9FIRM|nr:LCP family protein [Caldicellulosiruptor naganoensis]WAM30719.1 LCP family protein [Caldicellulosiruptor naganoensis]
MGRIIKNKPLIIILCIAIVLVGTLGCLYKVFIIDTKNIEKVFDKKRSSKSKMGQIKYPFDENSVNILVVGLDKASNRSTYDLHRTDTILFLNINFKDKKVKGISIPRDTLTEIYKVGKWDKINSAFGYGGGEKKEGFFYTMETVSKLLGGMPIEYYVGFDLDAVRKVVNILGGVYVNVEVPVKVKTKWVDIDLKPGYQKLNGIETLYYALWRKTPGGDIDRIKRDKELMLSIFEQLKASNKIVTLPEIYWKIRRHFYTNLTLQQITSLAYFAQSIKKEDIIFESIPGNYFNYRGISYWKPDYEGIKKLIKDLLGYDIEIDLKMPEKYKYTESVIVKGKSENNKNNISYNNHKIVTTPDNLSRSQTQRNDSDVSQTQSSVEKEGYQSQLSSQTNLENTESLPLPPEEESQTPQSIQQQPVVDSGIQTNAPATSSEVVSSVYSER